MRLVFDCESTGLRKDKLPVDDPSQPRIVQLGAALFDGRWNKVASLVTLIRPDGWSIEPGAEAHHGISEARCAKYGVPIEAALSVFQGMCDSALQIIGHHVNFDRSMITSELAHLKADGMWFAKKAAAFACTMELSTSICQLPGNAFSLFKYPSLGEAYSFFTGETFVEKHEAEHDLLATAKIAQALEARGALALPRARPAALDRLRNQRS